MLKSYGGWVVAYRILAFSVSLSPFRTNWVFELIGTSFGRGFGVLGTWGLGLGLDNNNICNFK